MDMTKKPRFRLGISTVERHGGTVKPSRPARRRITSRALEALDGDASVHLRHGRSLRRWRYGHPQPVKQWPLRFNNRRAKVSGLNQGLNHGAGEEVGPAGPVERPLTRAGALAALGYPRRLGRRAVEDGRVRAGRPARQTATPAALEAQPQARADSPLRSTISSSLAAGPPGLLTPCSHC